MLPRKFFGKNGVIWCNLGRPKVCCNRPKINNFKEINQQENLIAIFLSQINLDEHVSAKINTKQNLQGGSGGQKNFFEKSNKMEAFPYFFLLFGKAP